MSYHNSALTRCHKLTHLSVTVSGALAPDFLLYSSNHFMVSYKSHHMLIYQPFLLLICVHHYLFVHSFIGTMRASDYLSFFCLSPSSVVRHTHVTLTWETTGSPSVDNFTSV